MTSVTRATAPRAALALHAVSATECNIDCDPSKAPARSTTHHNLNRRESILKHLARFAALAAIVTVSAANAASVDQFTFVEGGSTYTWQEAVSPTVVAADGYGFHLADVAGTPGPNLEFYTASDFGGFTTDLVNFYSAQVFSGSTATPTFVLGTYTGTDYYSGHAATLTISAVPEAGNAAMLMAGLGLMGFVARRRAAATRA